MNKHDAWKDEAIAMKLAGVPIAKIAHNFGVTVGIADRVTRGTKSGHHTNRYVGTNGFMETHRKQHAVRFNLELFDDINAYARDKDMSFSSAVASLAAKALSDIRSAS